MAYTDRQIIDFLFKKIGYVIAKTGGEAYTPSTTFGTAKAPTSESIGSPLVVPASSVWTNSANIPATPPAADTTDVKVYLSSSPLQLSKDTSVASQRTWLACTTLDNLTTRIGDWIDPGNFGSQYLVKVYKGPLSSGSVQGANQVPIQGSGNNDSWFFDYSNGVLNFGDSNNPISVSDTLYLVGYRYIGTKGVSGGGGGSVSVQDEGTTVGTAATLFNFVGSAVAATYNSGITTVTISGGGASSQWTTSSTGVTTTGFVGITTNSFGNNPLQVGSGTTIVIVDQSGDLGIGTAAATEKLHVVGNIRVAGTGIVTATRFVGDGSGLTGVVGAGSGVVVQDEGSPIGTAGTINFVGQGVTATLAAGTATITISGGGGGSSLNISTSTSSSPQDIVFVGGASTTILGIATNTSRFVYNPNGGLIGINTGAPTYNLDIDGSIRIRSTNTLRFGGTSATTNFYIQYNSTSNSLDFVAG